VFVPLVLHPQCDVLPDERVGKPGSRRQIKSLFAVCATYSQQSSRMPRHDTSVLNVKLPDVFSAQAQCAP